MTRPAGSLPPDVAEALRRGQPLEAIKRLRAASAMGLREAKAAIEAHGRQAPEGFAGLDAASGAELPEPVVRALREGNTIEAVRLLRQLTGIGLKDAYARVRAADIAPDIAGIARDGLAPGEVPRRAGGDGWIIVLVVAALLVYWVWLRDPG